MRLVLALSLLLSPTAAFAQLDTWAEGSNDRDDGATRDFYNRGAQLRWQQSQGDWLDRDGTPHGSNPFASTNIADTDEARWIEWDVSELVNAWAAGQVPPHGFFVKSAGGAVRFSSREGSHPPELVLDGEPSLAVADTYLDASTYQSQGEGENLTSGFVLVRFAPVTGPVQQATLRMYTTRQFGGGGAVEVFAVRTSHAPAPQPQLGLAADHVADEGLGTHPDVLLFEDYEPEDWASDWTWTGGGHAEPVGASEHGFEPLSGRALEVFLPEGELTALNHHFDFQEETGEEPEEIFLRYYLRLGSDWDQSVDGGKMPGISGTYETAGWGGRKSDGTNGWSARGSFGRTIPTAANPLGGRTPLGSYVYHADMATNYGDVHVWNQAWDGRGIGGLLETGRWVCLETQVKMNTPGDNDGVLRAWVDGVLSFEKTDYRYRDVDRLKIQRIWMNIYHGGTAPSPYDQHLFIDNVVVARRYIGPMGQRVMMPADAGIPDQGLDAGGSDGAAPDAGLRPDAGAPDVGPTDAGPSPDAATPIDAGTEPVERDDGCRCAHPAARREGFAGLLLLGLLALTRRRAFRS